MKLLTDTPFQVAAIPSSLMVGQSCLLVVVKGTFDLVHEGTATLSDTQRPLSGDVFFDDDTARSLVYPSDFALIKPHAECFVLGHCHPENPESVSAVAFEIGAIRKGFGVYGDRQWERGLWGSKPSPPKPFERMSLRWERAYGGAGHDHNPSGTGTPEGDADGTLLLPNLERIDAPIVSPKDQPEPISTYPISPLWKSRMQHAGTYDQRWHRDRYPYLPSDFDPAYFNAAPSDQIISGYWKGDEAITLKGIVPGHGIVRTRLGGFTVRAFVRRDGDLDKLEDFPMTLDTITVQADDAKVECVWRGRVDVQDGHATDISDLFVAHEQPGERASAAEFLERMEAVEVLNHIEASGFKPRSPEHRMDIATVMLSRFAQHTEIFRQDDDALTIMKTLMKTGELTKTLIRIPEQLKPPASSTASTSPVYTSTPSESDEANCALESQAPLLPSQTAVLQKKLSRLLEEAQPSLSQFQAGERESAAIVEAAMATLPASEPEAASAPRPPSSAPLSEKPSRPRSEVVLECHRAEASVTLDLTELSLEGQSLPALQAPGVRGLRINCAEANLSGANFAGAQLSGGLFTSADLRQADLQGADLSHANLRGARLNGANLDGTNLDGANLDGAVLDACSLKGATLRAANLESSSLRACYAAQVDLSKANLQGADCREADFSKAIMHGTLLQDANLQKANLTAARVRDGARLDGADLRYVQGEGARFVGSQLTGANFSFAQLNRCDFSKAEASKAIFVAASIREANFQGAMLQGAAIQQSDALRASFREACLVGVHFGGSNLYQAEFFLAQTEDLNLELANVQGTRLEVL